MKCCEKWKRPLFASPIYPSFPNTIRSHKISFCPECGSKLESEWCRCEEGLTAETALGLSQEKINLLLEKKCFRCEKPIKPKEYCECENPQLTGNYTIPEMCKKCNKPIQCYDCHKPIKPKRELPEKLHYFGMMWEKTFGDKINEILDYLKEAL